MERRINKRRPEHDQKLMDLANALLLKSNLSDEEILTFNRSWKIVCADQKCSMCWYYCNTIVISLFATKSLRPGYVEYMLAHEIAHAFAGHDANHGPVFMGWLKRLCPEEYQHYEYGYKPRNARAAGLCGRPEKKTAPELTIKWKKISNGHYIDADERFEILARKSRDRVYCYGLFRLDMEVRPVYKWTIRECKLVAESLIS